jgi:hypothetical protein
MAQVEFFGTAKDELFLINQIAKDNFIKCSKIENKRLIEWIDFRDLVVPEYDLPLEICIWKSDIDNLKWITSEPIIDKSSHNKLVKSIFTKEYWVEQKKQDNFDKMIDNENSPIFYYNRGLNVYGYRLPNVIYTPQSSIDKLGADFKKWFNRNTSWIKRNGNMVYSLKMNEVKFRNDMSFANTIYALPDAKELIDSNNHSFALSINTQKFDK